MHLSTLLTDCVSVGTYIRPSTWHSWHQYFSKLALLLEDCADELAETISSFSDISDSIELSLCRVGRFVRISFSIAICSIEFGGATIASSGSSSTVEIILVLYPRQ